MKYIQGLNTENCPILISQYADDTSLMLDGTETSLRESIDELDKFAKISGLKINLTKTQIIWIGSKKYSTDTFLHQHKLQWGKEKFTLLGIEFCVNLHQIPKLNFDKKLTKLKSLIKSWSRRTLTPIGKIHIIKSLLISQFNHLFISLPNPDEQFIKNLNSILFNYLWNSSNDKIKREVIIQQYADGGLKMVNLKAYIDSLKLSWIRRLYQTTAKWQLILKSFVDVDLLTNTGSEYITMSINTCKNKFWKDVLKAWVKLRDLDRDMTKDESLLKTPIWYNKYISIGKKSVFYKDWYKKGVYIVHNFIKNVDTNDFYTLEEFNYIYHVNANFLNFHGITAAIKKFLTPYNLTNLNLEYPMIPINIKIFLKSTKGAKIFYNILVKTDIIPTGRKKWDRMFNLDDKSWNRIYCTPFQVTKNTKLQWLQFRIVHHILTTNSFLFKVNLVDSPLCTFCNAERETLIHTIWECREVQQLLQSLENLLDSLFIAFHYNKQSFIFGLATCTPLNRVDNEIIMLIKQYIYIQYKMLS